MKPRETKSYLPHALVLSGGALWGCIGLFSRSLLSAGLSVRSIVLVRNFGSLVMLGIILLIFDRSVFKIRPRHLPYFFGTGVVSVLLFTLCYFSCQQETGSLAVAAVLLYTAPAFVVLLSALLWRERITKKKLAALALAFLGCTLVTGLWSGGGTVSLRGALLGVGSGLFYGLYSIFGHYALQHYKPLTVTFYTFVFAGFTSLVLIDPGELAAAFSLPYTALSAAGLVLISTVAPYLLYTGGLAKLESGKAAILASVEPVVAALAGVIAFGEPMGWGVIGGLVCILLSVVILG